MVGHGDVMHLVVEHGHRSVLYFAGPKDGVTPPRV